MKQRKYDKLLQSNEKLLRKLELSFEQEDISKFESMAEDGTLLNVLSTDKFAYYLSESYKMGNKKIISNMLDITARFDDDDLTEVMIAVIDSENNLIVREFFESVQLDDHDVYIDILKAAASKGQLSLAEFIFSEYQNMEEEIEFEYIEKDRNSWRDKKYSYYQMVEFLDRYPFKINPREISEDAFILSVYFNELDIMERILDDGDIEVTIRDNFALRYACDHGYTEIVRKLLEYPIQVQCDEGCYDPDLCKNHNFLKIAKSHDAIVELLESYMD